MKVHISPINHQTFPTMSKKITRQYRPEHIKPHMNKNTKITKNACIHIK